MATNQTIIGNIIGGSGEVSESAIRTVFNSTSTFDYDNDDLLDYNITVNNPNDGNEPLVGLSVEHMLAHGFPTWLSGAAHNGTTDDTSKLNTWLAALPDHSVVIWPAGKTTRVTANLNPPNDKYQTWMGYGHTILFNPDSGTPDEIIRVDYGQEFQDAVTSISNTTLTVNAVARPITEITLTTAANATLARYPEGRRIKLVSDDTLPDGTDSLNQEGDWVTVINVDTGSGIVKTTRPYDISAFSTNPRIARPKEAGFDIIGMKLIYEEADVRANSRDVQQILVIGGRRFHAEAITSEYASGIVCHAVGVEDFTGTRCFIGNASDKSYDLKDLATGDYNVAGDRVTNSVGYAFADSCCGSTKIINNYAYNVRHFYSSNVQQTNSNPSLNVAYWGRSTTITITGNTVVGCFSSAIDTHAACTNISIIGNIIEDCAGVAIAMRANQGQITGNSIRRCAIATQIFAAGNSTPRINVDNNNFELSGKFEVWGGVELFLGKNKFDRDLDGNGNIIRVKSYFGSLPAKLYIDGQIEIVASKGANAVFIMETGAFVDVRAGGGVSVSPEDGTTGYQDIISFQRSATNQTYFNFGDKKFKVNGTNWDDFTAFYGSGTGTGTVPPKVYGNIYKESAWAAGMNTLTFTAGTGVQNLTDGFIV